MTRIFVFTNHKGGVGKSTSATNIAFGLAGMLRHTGAPNPRVLLVDTDSQGHATLVTTGTKDYGTDNSLYTVLMADSIRKPRMSIFTKPASYNIFVERLWRSVKYEDIYLKEYETVPALDGGLQDYFDFYNYERPHQSLGYRVPDEVYHSC